MSTLAAFKAEQKRRKLVAAAQEKWCEAVKGMGFSGTALRSGNRLIEKSKLPGRTVNALIREYSGRKPRMQAIETSPMADLSDVRALRVKLYRARGSNGWFPSDPQALALTRLERMVADGLARAEFDDLARTISRMAMPYKKWLLEDEKRGMGSFNQRDPLQPIACPDHMKKSIKR